MTRITRTLAALALLAVACSASPVLVAAERETARLMVANQVLKEMGDMRDQAIPGYLLERAYAIAVIPEVGKVGFVVAGRRGKGVLVVRDDDGRFTNPVFVTLTGGSVGWQAGAQFADVVLVFTSRRSLEGITDGKVTLGGEASIAAGPVGRQASAAVDSMTAEVYSYSRTRGLFAGVALDGSVVTIDRAANEKFYGRSGVSAADIMGGIVTTDSPQALNFLATVTAAASAGVPTQAATPQPAPASATDEPMPTGDTPPPGSVKVYPLDPSQPGEAPPN
jgi:lipid-binding SYLF domain-containing protein